MENPIDKTFCRKSNIELLKIVAMFFIVISHSIPYYGNPGADYYIDMTLATSNVSNFVLILFSYLGQIGNCIFIICSAWFLIDSNCTKAEKIYRMIIESLFFSILFLVLHIGLGVDVSIKDMIKCCMPITFENNWFIGCYLILYCMHQPLNWIIKKITQQQLLVFDICLLLMYSIGYCILGSRFYYTKLVGMIMIYFIVAYVKLYLKKISMTRNIICILGSSILLVGILCIINVLGLRISFFSDQMLRIRQFNNPLIILMSFGLFNIFKEKKFYSGMINKISSLSLCIYIIHENYLVYTYTKPKLWNWIYNNWAWGGRIVYALTIAVVSYLISLLIALLYKKLLGDCTNKVSVSINKFVNVKIQIVTNKIMNISREIGDKETNV